MISLVWKALVIALVIERSSSKDLFHSTEHLNKLLATRYIQQVVNNYIHEEEKKIAVLKQKLELIERMRITRDSGVLSSEHPVGAYHILRTYYDINATVNNHNAYNDYTRNSATGMPDEFDLLGASLGIVRLQKTFKLSAYDLIQGKIGTTRNLPLGAEEAYHIAKTAYDNQHYVQALSWMNAIYDTYKHTISGQFRKDILLHMAYCYEKTPDVHNLKKTLEIIFTFYPNDKEIHDYYNTVDVKMSATVGRIVDTEDSDIERYAALCRGDPVPLTHDTISHKHAVCRYRPIHGPYDSVKEEVLSLSPFVVFYHDVITDNENSQIRELAITMLETSQVGIDPSNASTSGIRVSKTAWLFDENIAVRISNRVSRITGLGTKLRRTNSDAEALQVVNYGIGGQYEPHLDAAPGVNHSSESAAEPIRGSGDRVATFLLYLTNVVMGGATVFPRAGLKVDAIKNGAVFWYNMHPSGTYDWLTLHAGCPVLLGQKWICNKWLREKGQMFRRPCGLHPSTSQAQLHRPHPFDYLGV